jgi:type IV pilus assembly protein PilY1
LWEFNNKSAGGANLGYTYGSPHIARLHNGKWAVMVPSGYYPKGPTTDAYDDPANTEAAASKTSLLIIDLQTGDLITELKTSTAPQASGVTTYGLSTPDFYDLGGDQVDDIGVAGDLAGNVWRFDLTSTDPASWAVDLLFKTYPSAATNGATGTCTAAGQCPVSVMPVGMRNPAARGIVWIFGTGKFLGKDDRNNAIPAQSFYGIYDYGLHSSNYPILPSKLNVQRMTEDTAVPPNRFVSKAAVTTVVNPQGWTLPLNIAAEQGERNVVAPFPLDSNNTVILPTLIPTSDDPCTPGRRGALIVLDAASGGGIAIGPSAGSPPGGYVTAGKVDTSGAIPVSGDLSPWQAVGGGTIGIAGIPGLTFSDNFWYRAAWRELLDVL